MPGFITGKSHGKIEVARLVGRMFGKTHNLSVKLRTICHLSDKILPGVISAESKGNKTVSDVGWYNAKVEP